LLGYLTEKLLSGRSFQVVLDELAASLVDEMRLARCEIWAASEGRELRAVAVGPTLGDGAAQRIPVAVADRQLGWIEVVAEHGGELAAAQRDLLLATATQVGVALERTRLGDAVRDARLDAETSELRAALFSSVTHDLRTPLAAIKAGVTSLATEDAVFDPARRAELLATVTEETDRLDRLVGNILDLARARAGALVLERQKIGVDELIDALLTRLGPRLAGHEVETRIRPDVPDVWVDPVQLDQALTNVVENAIAHSPARGVIRITVTHFRSKVEIRIADSGPGIPPEERERVFEPFSRGDDARSRPGSGLGLAIARAVVVSHGGSIRIEDAPGGGAAILIELPAWHEGVEE
jgi:two-component system sensor histidine kinase KdpD